jgi:Ca2+-binding EF-hand superfamily protein
MGCGGSKIDALDFVREMYPRTLAFLELTPYSRKLADLFVMNDKNHDQKLVISEFLKTLNVLKTRASVRLFSICDMDGTGTLDFRETMFTIWHLCTVDVDGLAYLVFDVYDEDQNGVIDYDDLYRLLVDCYGRDHMEKVEIKRVLERMEENGPINRLQFLDFAKRSPQTLKQLIDTQTRVREDTLGTAVWSSLEKKRSAKTDPVFRPVRPPHAQGKRGDPHPHTIVAVHSTAFRPPLSLLYQFHPFLQENWQDLFTRIMVLDIQARNAAARENLKNQVQQLSVAAASSQEQAEPESGEEEEEQEVKKKKKKKEYKLRPNKVEKKHRVAPAHANVGGDVVYAAGRKTL